MCYSPKRNASWRLRRASELMVMVLLGGCATQNASTQPPQAQMGESEPSDTAVDPLTAQAMALSQADNRYRHSKKTLDAKIKQHAERALEKVAAKQWQAADALVAPLLLDEPTSSLWTLAGDIAVGQNKADEAINAYLKAVELNPDNPYAHNRLAMRYREDGDFRSALDHYNQAIAAWPGFAKAYRNRGILKDLYLGQKREALRDYQLYQQLITLANKPSKQSQRQIKAWLADLQHQIDSDEPKQEVAHVLN